MQILSVSPRETERLGEGIGKLVRAGDFIGLSGDLGAGKTMLVKGIARGAGVGDDQIIVSPTYTLLNCYAAPVPVYHFDLYRLNGPDDCDALGFDEYFFGTGLSLVEWPERLASSLPPERLDIVLSHAGENARMIELAPVGDGWLQRVSGMQNFFDRNR